MENPKNLILIIFGASGDLANRMLIPSIFSLKIQNLLPEMISILGIGRTELTTDQFRLKMKDGIRKYHAGNSLDEAQLNAFTDLLSYTTMDMTSPEAFVKLKSLLAEIDTSLGTGGNYIFYLAIPPNMYKSVTQNLALADLGNQSLGFRRVVIEKPFGYDYDSCRDLNRSLHEKFSEEQLYRIDHYLGKETVQNLLVTRFANGMFEPLWNRNYIHRVEITSAESIGIENRGRYFDSSGTLCDMVQNHLLQIVGMTAMEPPSSMDSDAIRNEILKVFQSFKPIREEDVDKQVIRGQYTASRVRGECLTGYRHEKDVNPLSRTETFVAIKFFIDNWRWGGVPFYIRSGKRLPTRVTEIVVHFKPTPHHLFHKSDKCEQCNQLIIRIQPDEGILLKFGMKEPGAGFNVRNVSMDFHYKDLSEIVIPSAYERLIHDVMLGDSTLFSRDDVVETAWKFLSPIQKVWASNPDAKIAGYPAGTWGPEHSNDLIEEHELTWRYPCKNLADDETYCEL